VETTTEATAVPKVKRKKIARLSKRQRRTLKRHELRLAAAPKANIHCGRHIHSVAVIGKDLVITGHCKLTRQHELALATLTGAPLPKCFKFMAFWRKRLSNDQRSYYRRKRRSSIVAIIRRQVPVTLQDSYEQTHAYSRVQLLRMRHGLGAGGSSFVCAPPEEISRAARQKTALKDYAIHVFKTYIISKHPDDKVRTSQIKLCLPSSASSYWSSLGYRRSYYDRKAPLEFVLEIVPCRWLVDVWLRNMALLGDNNEYLTLAAASLETNTAVVVVAHWLDSSLDHLKLQMGVARQVNNKWQLQLLPNLIAGAVNE